MNNSTHCGYVAIIGRPNVGKSTLLNRILGQKISITCRKPQTTRHQILGVKTTESVQTVYVDTPGIHSNQKKAINRYMNKAALSVVNDVDVIVFLVEANWTAQEDEIVRVLKTVKAPVILALNKVDEDKNKSVTLPLMQTLSDKMNFAEIIPISAKHGDNVEVLEELIAKRLPVGDFFYAKDQVTDRSVRFLVSEIIREKLMRFLGDELPYAVTVEIDLFAYQEETEQTRIVASILVERDSQKAMIIGKKGQKLKQIGREARMDINKHLEMRCHLELWVKVKSGWADDERALKSLGYD